MSSTHHQGSHPHARTLFSHTAVTLGATHTNAVVSLCLCCASECHHLLEVGAAAVSSDVSVGHDGVPDALPRALLLPALDAVEWEADDASRQEQGARDVEGGVVALG